MTSDRSYDPKRSITTVAYTDDAAIMCKARTVKEASVMMSKYLKKVHTWLINNRVLFNISKLATMIIISKLKTPTPSSVFFNNVLIKEVSHYKYLGLLMDNKLKWKWHIDRVLSKLEGVNRMLRGVVREK